MWEYLKRWGFMPQTPVKKAYDEQPKAVKKCLAETYPCIAAQARAEEAEIYWGDQTGVNNQPNAPRGYAPKGETPTVSQRSKRFGFSVMSAVTNRGSARWMVYQWALNSTLLIKFMTRLLKQGGGRKVVHPQQSARASQLAGQRMAVRARRSDGRASHAKRQPGTQP